MILFANLPVPIIATHADKYNCSRYNDNLSVPVVANMLCEGMAEFQMVLCVFLLFCTYVMIRSEYQRGTELSCDFSFSFVHIEMQAKLTTMNSYFHVPTAPKKLKEGFSTCFHYGEEEIAQDKNKDMN